MRAELSDRIVLHKAYRANAGRAKTPGELAHPHIARSDATSTSPLARDKPPAAPSDRHDCFGTNVLSHVRQQRVDPTRRQVLNLETLSKLRSTQYSAARLAQRAKQRLFLTRKFGHRIDSTAGSFPTRVPTVNAVCLDPPVTLSPRWGNATRLHPRS